MYIVIALCHVEQERPACIEEEECTSSGQH